MPHSTGETVNGYEVLRLLGRGACGEVLKVLDAEKNAFAMKVIPCDSITDAAAEKNQQAALREARLLQKLRHPHIVACHDVFFDKDQNVVRLVLEYMDGGDLQELLASRVESDVPAGGSRFFPAHFPRRVLAAVGGALAQVHAAGILHRDVKPANILLAKGSHRIKLGDFGISKLVEADTLKAKTVIGTPYYFSPELISSEEYGTASDCWALGACLYEVVALRRPFEAANQLALIRKICEDSPSDVPFETAEDVRAAVWGFLRKEPVERMRLDDALNISPAVAVLVVGFGQDGSATFGEDLESDEVQEQSGENSREWVSAHDTFGETHSGEGFASLEIRPDFTLTSEVSLRSPVSDAVAQARCVLAAEVDDPEDLQMALAALEKESFEARQTIIAGSSNENMSMVRESLKEELRVRVQALREEATALLDGLMLDDGLMQRSSVDEVSSGKVPPEAAELDTISDDYTPCAWTPASTSTAGSECTAACANDAEDALDKATSLGVDTTPAEERLVSVRRMLSVRVCWEDRARFCLLPMRVTYAALLRQVASRFCVPPGTSLQLYWTEGEDSYNLDSQQMWEELLQRRGLMGHPGRIELRIAGIPLRRRARTIAVPSFPKPPRPSSNKAADQRGTNVSDDAAVVATSVNGFIVTGTQALRTASSTTDVVAACVPADCFVGGRGRGTSRRKQGDARRTSTTASGGRTWATVTGREQLGEARKTSTAASGGRAWAMATGREQPVRWAPGYGTAQSKGPQDGSAAGLDLCLEGRSTGFVAGRSQNPA